MVDSLSGDNPRFQLANILYSRSNSDGDIEAGNKSFQSISAYSWDELIGSPHKMLRDSATPRGVFHLLWTSIQGGTPIGAYLRNRAKDGTTYWVFATVVPIPGGYVSVRLKPSCGLLDKIRPVYETLCREEKENRQSPEESARKIEDAVKALGYRTYSEFMSFALRDEATAREEKSGRKKPAIWKSLTEIFDGIITLENRAREIETTFKQTHQIPYNMRLQAGRLEGSDGPISVISGNHRQMTQSLEENMARFGADSSVGAEAVRLALFKTCLSHVVNRVIDKIDSGTESLHLDETKERHILEDLAVTCRAESGRDIKILSEKVRRFGIQCQDIRRMMSGLELTRIMCKIERSKFQGDHAGLDEIVNRLADAQESLGVSFDSIKDAVAGILQKASEAGRGVNQTPLQSNTPTAA